MHHKREFDIFFGPRRPVHVSFSDRGRKAWREGLAFKLHFAITHGTAEIQSDICRFELSILLILNDDFTKMDQSFERNIRGVGGRHAAPSAQVCQI